MGAPPGKLKDIPVEVYCATVDPILIRKARITCREEGYCEVVLDAPEEELTTGMRVVLDGGPDTGLRIKGVIGKKEGRDLRVDTPERVPPDKRGFPRIQGGIRLRYRVAPKAEAEKLVPAWTAGEEIPGDEGAWYAPDPFMDFSGSGLKFEDRLRCDAGDVLLLQLQIPPEKEPFRAVAKVVRTEAIVVDEENDPGEGRAEEAPSHKVAVEFIDLPQKGAEALGAFMLRIQDALLVPEEHGSDPDAPAT